MHVQKGDFVRVFLAKGEMCEGKVTGISDDVLALTSTETSYHIGWNAVSNVLPMPHPDPNHMFDKYHMRLGDLIHMEYYTVNGKRKSINGFVVQVNQSVIVLTTKGKAGNNAKEYKVICPFNLKKIKILGRDPYNKPQEVKVEEC